MSYGVQTLSLLIAAGIAAAAAPDARAEDRAATGAASPWVVGAEAKVRLVSGADKQGRPLFGLTFRLRDGWKIFWRSPGAPGVPPQLDWRGSRNLTSGTLVWPAPQLFTSFGFHARGYGGNVTLPIRVVATDATRPVKARLLVRYQVCKDVCIPGEARLALTLPVKAPPHAAIQAALSRAPRQAGKDFPVWQVRLDARRPDARQLVINIRHRHRRLARPVVILEPLQRLRLGRTGPVKKQGDGSLSVVIPILGGKPVPAGLTTRVTVLDGARSWEKTVPVSGLLTR